MSKAATQSKAQVFLDELDLNISGPIVAMICRKWDVNAVTGHYLNTDFRYLMGRVIPCIALQSRRHHTILLIG
ncbi:hypothetical protein OROHE_014877 [Orobanche hederae]